MKVFQYAKCGTCRKALKWLQSNSVAYEAIDIVEAPPSEAELRRILALSTLPVSKLFNTSGQVYKAGRYKDKMATMSLNDAIADLSTNGKLIKRPLILGQDFALVGFQEEQYATRFGAAD